MDKEKYMNDKTKLLFGVHMHQPVDNFSEAVDEAVKKCYEPFFEIFKCYPTLKIALHCSGWLLEYIKKNHNKLFKNIKKLSINGNIEIFSAGFYEPVLSSIPKKDRIAQIKKLNKTIKKEFLQTPKGAWLTERVWDDSLIDDFAKCGIEYVMVDDYHLIVSGFDESKLQGYFYSEYNGKKIALFPINKALRYALPFKSVKEAIKDIKEQKNGIIFDDLEKFGLWPKTYEWVYEKGWLKEFFETLQDDKEIQSIHFSEFYKSEKALSLAYLQNVSYYEMGQWCLKSKNALELEHIKDEVSKKFPQSVDKFVKGGTWKNFFIKYEESNRLHKRMIEVSKNALSTKAFLDSLYRLQTNDVFWHGVFGGLYLPNLRDNAYKYLTICEDLRYKDKEVIEINDVDINGYDEIKVVSKKFIARFDSHYGGQMIELLDRDKKFNFQNVLTRYEEAYHKEIAEQREDEKEDSDKNSIASIHNLEVQIDEEIKNALHYDWYIKNSFVDHISNETFTLENFKNCSFWEYSDFANQPFEYEVDNNIINFKREGGIYFDKKYLSTLEKKYILNDNELEFLLNFSTVSDEKYKYALEFNFHFTDLKNIFFEDKNFSNEINLKNIREFYLLDSWSKKKIIFTFDKEFELLSTPLYTVSKSEKGYDLMIQGVSFAFIFPFSKSFNISGKMRIENV